MNETCGAEHARWLEIALAEGPEALDTSARRVLEACPHCSRELSEVAALEDLLSGAVEEEREVLASLTPDALERELEFVSEVHRTRMAPAPAPVRAPRGARYAVWLAAAGVLLGLYLLLTRDRTPGKQLGTPPQEGVLLSGDHALSALNLEPNASGSVEAYERLRWQAGEQVASSWQVVVRDPSGQELWRDDRVSETSLELDPRETATWPDRIQWTVTPRDMGGRLRPEAAVRAEALRSR